MQTNIKVCYKLISTSWASKFPAKWYYYYWWTWTSFLKVLKVTSLPYLYNISKGKEFIFLHADKHQSFYKLALSFLMEMDRHAQSIENRKLVLFLQYFTHVIKYFSVTTAFVFYCELKHSDILQASSYVCCYLLETKVIILLFMMSYSLLELLQLNFCN